jgi:regulation of enolase protein 1 (concanavalin A-like superfamily)
MADSYQSSHYDYPIPDVSKPFDLRCPDNTDLWRIPPSTDRGNTPHIYRKIAASKFKSAKVTVSGPWTKLYDQGGLCMIINIPGAEQNKWVKTGIEMLNGKPRVSVVGTDTWSDWSLHPVVAADKVSATIEMVVQDDHLWVYLLGDDGERHPMREITWWNALPKDAECKIGVSAARPASDGGELVVHYENLIISA